MAQQSPGAVAITGGAINGTPIGATTRAAGTFSTLSASGSVSVPVVPQTAWSLDFSGNGQTLASGASLTLPQGSGLIILNNWSDGDVGVYAVGGGVVALIASTAGSFVSGSAAAGKIGLSYTNSAYTVTSSYGSSVTISAALLRTRPFY